MRDFNTIMPPCRARRNSAGMALPVTLMLLALIAALTIQAQLAARSRLAREHHAGRHTRLRALAADAAWQALRAMAAEADSVLTHTNAAWARPVETHLPDGTLVATRLSDAMRHFNVNNIGVATLPVGLPRLPVAITAGLLEDGACPASDIAARLQNWFLERQDGDTGAVMRGTGELLELMPEIAPDRAFELFGVLPSYAGALAPVNVNTVPPDVLRAVLGPSRAFAADALIQRRDAQPLAALEHFSGWREIVDLAAYLDVRSMFFEVEALASDDAAQVRVWALAERDPKAQWRVRRWVCR